MTPELMEEGARRVAEHGQHIAGKTESGGRQAGFQCVWVASSPLAAHFTYRRR